MAKPVAYFGYSKSGMTVNFVNSSLNSPTSFQWDFGDGTTSIEKSPSHTFSEMGFFTVTLIASNTDGDSEPLVLTIGAGNVNDMLNASILELIDHYLPSALKGELGATEKISLIQKWQLYLQPLVLIPYRVLEQDTYNEFKWPGLVNSLIAQLVSYDIVLQGANQFLSTAGSISDIITDSDSESEGSTDKEQQIKSIETGPAKTEWYQNEDAKLNSEVIKNIGEAFSSSLKAGGGGR